MSEELMPCPICGDTDLSCGWDADSQGQAVECSTDASPWHYKVAARNHTEAIEAHNTLARRARIGELVEEIVTGPDGEVRIVRLMDSFIAEGDEENVYAEGDTLLAALEALAQEIGGDDGK